MLKSMTMRGWATPLTIGSFLLMAVTGIMMFFDFVPGYVAFAHEWLSWVFLIGVGAHIAVNYRPFMRHLQNRAGLINVLLFAAILLVSTYSFGQITAPQLKWPIMEALVEAPLSVLAELTKTDESAVVNSLMAHGISARPDQTILELAEAHDQDRFHILGLIILGR
jgi:hypothetical protein